MTGPKEREGCIITHVEGILEDCCLLLAASGLELWGLGFRLVLSKAYSG